MRVVLLAASVTLARSAVLTLNSAEGQNATIVFGPDYQRCTIRNAGGHLVSDCPIRSPETDAIWQRLMALEAYTYPLPPSVPPADPPSTPPSSPPPPSRPPTSPPPPPPPPPTELLAVNFVSDLGTSFNGYTYSANVGQCNSPASLEQRRAGSPACATNYGIGMNSMALTTSTVIRLECIDGAGDLMQMYIRGISTWDTAFQAGGTVGTSGLECSLSPDFEPALSSSGSGCFSLDNSQHTYWQLSNTNAAYNSGRRMSWALFSAGLTATLRHCSYGPGSSGNSGATHFKGSIWIMDPPYG